MDFSMRVKQYVDSICQKFNYDSQLASFLHQAIPALIKYYGIEYEEKIFKTFETCEIHIQKEGEDASAYLSQYFGEEIIEEEKFIGPRAFNMPTPTIENNEIVLKNIIYVKNDHFNHFDFSDEEWQSTLIHEMCHAIKTDGHIKKDGDIITVSSGLIKLTYKYNPETGKLEDLYEYNMEIEEALNVLDEFGVMSIMKNRPFRRESGYASMIGIAKRMMSIDDIAKIIKTSQLSGGDEWIDYLGEDICNFLVSNFSKLQVNISQNSNVPDGKKMPLRERMRIGNKAKEQLNEFFDNYIVQNWNYNQNETEYDLYEEAKEEYERQKEGTVQSVEEDELHSIGKVR